MTIEVWPSLPLAEWKDTYATLHLWTQILGKTRLALSPKENHCWQTALYVSVRGLTTSPIPYGNRAFEVELDFLDHRLRVRTSEGREAGFALEPMSVAEFYRRYLRVLRSLDIEFHMWRIPAEVADRTPLDEDRKHASYDADAAQRCWRIMALADRAMRKYRSRFVGKSSPSHFWWGAFDLACTRFSGRVAPVHPGGVPFIADRVVRDAYSHECMSVGWWPGGSAGELREPPVLEPAFYAYAYPEPPGFAQLADLPAPARYHPTMFEWILPYEAVRTAEHPHSMIDDFFEGAYHAAARLGHWDNALERAA